MLRPDSPRWLELYAGGGDAASIPRWLYRLLDSPDDFGAFEQAWWMLCSDEITWSAGFAAAPVLVEAARRAQPANRAQYVCFLGSLVMYRVSHEEVGAPGECPPDLEAEFQEAVAAASEMAIALLPLANSEPEVRHLLAAIAAFKGFSGLARGIVDLPHDKRQEPPVEDINF